MSRRSNVEGLPSRGPPQQSHKPNSVSRAITRRRPRRATTIPLAPPSLAGSCDLPGGYERATLHASLFGLAPCGVLPAIHLAVNAVRSYRTFSPLPRRAPFGDSIEAVCFLCHFPSGHPDRGLPGALPCGVRTFLPARPDRGQGARSGRLANCGGLSKSYPSVSWRMWYCSSFL